MEFQEFELYPGFTKMLASIIKRHVIGLHAKTAKWYSEIKMFHNYPDRVHDNIFSIPTNIASVLFCQVFLTKVILSQWRSQRGFGGFTTPLQKLSIISEIMVCGRKIYSKYMIEYKQNYRDNIRNP